jgi:predicted Zn-dependent protease
MSNAIIVVCLLLSGVVSFADVNMDAPIDVYIEHSDPNHEQIILNAMKYWEKHRSVSFNIVENVYDADIVVRWTDDINGKGEFGGRGGYVIEDTSRKEIVLEYFDNGLKWWLYGKRTLKTVAIHEFGHALGLQDTNKLGDVMNPKSIRIPSKTTLKIIEFLLPTLSFFMLVFIVRHYLSYLRAKRERYELERFMKE